MDQASFCSASWQQLRHASHELTRRHLTGLLEALLFAASEPLSLRDLTRATKAPRPLVKEVLEHVEATYRGRGIQLQRVANAFTFRSNPNYAPYVRGLTGKRPLRMSRAQLETISIIAYRQPVTRPEIDDVRGVDCGPVLRTLLDREMIRILGKKEEPGRPLLYGTTDQFLKLFGLNTLADLPTLREFTELSDDSRDTYERALGQSAPSGAIVFDDEPDAPIDPTQATDDEEEEAFPTTADDADNDALGVTTDNENDNEDGDSASDDEDFEDDEDDEDDED